MVTNRHEIRRIDPVKREYTQVVSTQKNAVALDVDVANNRIFWSDRFHRKIYRYGLSHRTVLCRVMLMSFVLGCLDTVVDMQTCYLLPSL